MVYYLSAGSGPTVAVQPLVLSEALRHHLELSLHFTTTAAASELRDHQAENHETRKRVTRVTETEIKFPLWVS